RGTVDAWWKTAGMLPLKNIVLRAHPRTKLNELVVSGAPVVVPRQRPHGDSGKAEKIDFTGAAVGRQKGRGPFQGGLVIQDHLGAHLRVVQYSARAVIPLGKQQLVHTGIKPLRHGFA